MKKNKEITLDHNIYSLPRPATSPSKGKRKEKAGAPARSANTPPPRPQQSGTSKYSKLSIAKQLPRVSTVADEKNFLEQHLTFVFDADLSFAPPDAIDILDVVVSSIRQRTAATKNILVMKKKLIPVIEGMCHCLFKACGAAKLEDSVAILKSYLAEQQLSVDKCAAVVVLLEAVLSLQFQLNSQYRPTKEELSSMDALVTHGHPGGMLLVSNLLRDGVGVEKNAAASLDWLRKSAELRYVPALHELADLHEKGCSDGATSIEADWGEAVHLYKIAASAGYAASQLNLGKLWLEASQEAAANHLCSTEEVEDMMKSARQWLSEAAKNGSSEAKSLRERL